MGDPKAKAIGYIKASTGRVGRVNPDPEDQEAEIKAYAEAEGLELVRVYREKVLGGNIVNKEELEELYRDIREGYAGTVLIYKGDRITRRWSMHRFKTEKSEGDLEED
ncbi:MAG: recombinase family protein [Pseudomonadota bacterium]